MKLCWVKHTDIITWNTNRCDHNRYFNIRFSMIANVREFHGFSSQIILLKVLEILAEYYKRWDTEFLSRTTLSVTQKSTSKFCDKVFYLLSSIYYHHWTLTFYADIGWMVGCFDRIWQAERLCRVPLSDLTWFVWLDVLPTMNTFHIKKSKIS